MGSIGILVGCDANQEWLLPWWYAHLQKHHHPLIPVAFADFGMSLDARKWCQERGEILDIPPLSSSEKGFILSGQRWIFPVSEETFQKGLRIRTPTWFMKPLAMQKTPFQRTLWLDLDCEILSDLSPLFSLPLPAARFRIRRGTQIRTINVTQNKIYKIQCYNSGVILYEKKGEFLPMWSQGCQDGRSDFPADDPILSLIIAEMYGAQIDLPFKYNWNATDWGPNPYALVYHWERPPGKQAIRFLRMGH